MPLPARLILAALAGVAAAVSFEPLRLVLLLPIAVAAAALLCRGLNPGRGFLVGSIFGAAFMLVLLPWLQVIGVDAWLALSIFEGLFYGLLGIGTVVVQRLPGWPLWVAALWSAVEALRSIVPFGGFPWGRLAFATVDTPLQNFFPYVGSAGVTFAVALLGSTLAWASITVVRLPLTAVAVVAGTGVLLSIPAVLPWDVAPTGDTVTVAAVQGNVPGEGMNAFSERRAVLDNHVDATREHARDVAAGKAPKPDLVIWPENSTDIDPFEDDSVYADIQGAVDSIGVPVLVGAMVEGKEPGEVLNQGIVWSPKTGPGDRYAKMHPVPFGEYIPFREVLAKYIERLDQIPRDMVPGTEPGLLDINGVPVGDVICFEVAYDGLLRDVVRRGAGVVVVQTNNATYMGTGQVEQQFAISRLRALETGRYVVVAATNGVTGYLAPDGTVIERAKVRTQAVLSHKVQLGTALSPAIRWGSRIEMLLGLLAVLSFAAGVVVHRYRRRSRSTVRSYDTRRTS